MGICDSKGNDTYNNQAKSKVNNNKIGVKSDTTGVFGKYNYTDTNILSIKQKNKGYLLPEVLAKRDDINKYYKIKEKILGEGAFGQVCIGEKNGIKYAIKKIKKDKLTEIKPLILEAEISLQIKHENIIAYYEIF